MSLMAAISLWRNRDYMGWWLGDTVSSLGSAMSGVAYPLLMLYATGSAAQAGTVAAGNNIGLLVTMLLGGALADRYPRRRLLILGPLAQGVSVSIVVWAVLSQHVNVVLITAVAIVQGLAAGVTGGADRPALRRLVPAEQLPVAFAQSQGREMTARLTGPPIGGLLFAVARWVPFAADAVSFVVGALGAVAIRRDLGPDADERSEPTTIRADITEGFAFIRGNSYLRFLTGWVAAVNATAAALMLMLAVLVRHRHGSSTTVGVVFAIGAAGGLIGAFLAPRVVRLLRGRTVFLVVAWLIGIACVVMAVVPEAWQIGAALALFYLFLAPANVVFETYELRLIPDRLLGRVSTAISFGAQSLRWIGPPAAGLLADRIGVVATVLVLAGLFLVLAVISHFVKALYLLNEPVEAVPAGS